MYVEHSKTLMTERPCAAYGGLPETWSCPFLSLAVFFPDKNGITWLSLLWLFHLEIPPECSGESRDTLPPVFQSSNFRMTALQETSVIDLSNYRRLYLFSNQSRTCGCSSPQVSHSHTQWRQCSSGNFCEVAVPLVSGIRPGLESVPDVPR